MFWQTSIKPQQLTLCGCSVLHVAVRPSLSGKGIDHLAWRPV
jgi:hypothetical protein